ncbi:hypothetical protein ACFSJY_00105 [Thalassotalea euphylliae]|uniref:hypothetical protein n=1 Tax=Thalassotalea euphylliae TaxID=1655234 RepID=UPI00362EE6FF
MSPRDNEFDDWLDKKLTKEQCEAFENDLSNEQEMKEQIATAKYVEYLAEQNVEQTVPEWDRTAGIEFEEKHWWQWQGLPAVSMAFSCFAMALVLFNVRVSVNEEGMLLAFGKQHSEQHVAKLVSAQVDEKMKELQYQQQLTLANFTATLTEKQQQSNLQLASYILDTSRQERKEDMSDFIQFINDQRQDDMLEQRIMYRQLEESLRYQSPYSTDNNVMQPASWVVEE